ncbi:LysR family transcriptional regulator [Rudaea cellulosilytica]|uniref:LysR family transcriptional regulator n=1 Tax=Rudaea cellulosilytica TaxID=540746 RepID=UPI00037E33DD|nr:LysR family transcriptional regulator [Rudaea cellulosilytica]
MNRLEAMSVLLLTVEKGTLTAAAKELHMPLPTVSRKISELEAHLGAKLLQRSTRKLTLTEAGRSYVDGVRRILEDVDEVERRATGEYQVPRGELVLTAPVLFGQKYILPLVTDFLAQFPDINIRLLLSDRNLHLFDEDVDMAVRIGVLPNSRMRATRIGSMDTLTCATPELLATHGKPKHPSDMERLPCVVFTAPTTATWLFRESVSRKEFGVDIRPRLSVTSAEAAIQAALRHTGFTRVYRYHCAEHLRAGALVQVLRKFDVAPLPVHLIHGSQGQLPLKMRTFLDFAVPRLRDELALMSASNSSTK